MQKVEREVSDDDWNFFLSADIYCEHGGLRTTGEVTFRKDMEDGDVKVLTE